MSELRPGETLHLDGCTLPGDHPGPCGGVLLAYRMWLDRQITEWVQTRPKGKGHGDFDAGDWINEGILEGLRLARHGLLDALERERVAAFDREFVPHCDTEGS